MTQVKIFVTKNDKQLKKLFVCHYFEQVKQVSLLYAAFLVCACDCQACALRSRSGLWCVPAVGSKSSKINIYIYKYFLKSIATKFYSD